MILKTPLGLLGLLGIVVLIIIYMVKQNYQQKMISSTFIWKLSEKYRKKRVPISKFRNLLIFLCQMLAITVCALIMAWPLIQSDAATAKKEKILIIDAAANMLAVQESGETRFERAVREAREYGADAIKDGGRVTVILAGMEAEYVRENDSSGSVLRTNSVSALNAAMDSLVKPGNLRCSLGEPDIDGAMKLVEDVLEQNALCEVVYFSATKYRKKPNNVMVKDIFASEWNAAILDAKVKIEDNCYIFDVEVVSYNKTSYLLVEIEIQDVSILDAYGDTIHHELYTKQFPVLCSDGNSEFITLGTSKVEDLTQDRIVRYGQVLISIMEEDDFLYDNSMYLYGSKKEKINILYTSSGLNPFVDGGLMSLRTGLSAHWDIEIDTLETEDEFVTEGYDFYVFEHKVPAILPEDGAVLLINPDIEPVNLDLGLGDLVDTDSTLDSDVLHPILKDVSPQNIKLTQYRQLTKYDSFEPLMFCEGKPVFVVKNEKNSKVAVITFSLHYSDLPLVADFPILLRNMFHYFMPVTVEDSIFNVYDNVEINSRGVSTVITGQGINYSSDQERHALVLPSYGTYTIKQTLQSDGFLGPRTSERLIFARIAQNESNFARLENELIGPYVDPKKGQLIKLDTVIYLAAVLVALLFIEWWLQSRENI